jgi:hypothetical protein
MVGNKFEPDVSYGAGGNGIDRSPKEGKRKHTKTLREPEASKS